MPKFQTITVKSVVDLINRFTVSVRSDPSIVWRGQTCSEWPLTPSLFRSEPKYKDKDRSWDSREQGLLRYFSKSNLRWLKEHHAETLLDHLAIAQHHRLPTRLLDWTEIPLIAAFFACLDVAENPDNLSDGAVWRFQSNAVRFAVSQERDERTALPDGTNTPVIPEGTHGGLNGDFDTFLYYPQRLHPRQINQFAAYTVHPNPNYKNSSDLTHILRPEESLVKYIFPKEIKKDAFEKLWSLGTRYENIFPDPDGAAKGAKYVVETEDGSISTTG
jgi:hypothetical protein